MEAIVPPLRLILPEFVPGLDNVIFISVLAANLPAEVQWRARRTDLMAALFIRVALLAGIFFILKLEGTSFSVFGEECYIYFSMGFALLVDVTQMRASRRDVPPVNLREKFTDEKSL